MTNKINLVNDFDLAHCAAWAVFPSVWNVYTILQMEGVSEVSYELWYCVGILVYHITT